MKPTVSSQPHRQRNVPLTDYNYQSTLDGSATIVRETQDTRKVRGFWKLSTDYSFGSEVKLDYAAETVLFSIITALSAIQIYWMVVSLFPAYRW